MSAEEVRSRQRPAEHSIHFDFWPWDEHTQCRVYLRSLVGGVGREVVVWADNLPVGRRDLAGHPPAECAILLGDYLYGAWEQQRKAFDSGLAVGTGVPLGTTGGTVTQDTLPGL